MTPSRIFDIKRTEEQPNDPLTDLAGRMIADLPGGVKAIVMLDMPGRGGMVAHGHDNNDEIAETIARHRRAFLTSLHEDHR